MKDPWSTKFELVHDCGDRGSVVSGRYNAKNSYGAYEGFQTFYYDQGQVYLEDEAQLPIIEKCIRQTKAKTAEIRRLSGGP